MKHHSIITMPVLLKLLVVKIFHKATHHEKKAILGGTLNFHILLQGKCRSPLLRLYSSSSPGKLWFGKGHHTNISPHTVIPDLNIEHSLPLFVNSSSFQIFFSLFIFIFTTFTPSSLDCPTKTKKSLGC